MNLHALVAPIIGAINPNVTVMLRTGMGSITNPDFSRTPVYQTDSVVAQIQALTSSELRLMENIEVQGSKRAIYFYGDVSGIMRASLVRFPDGSVWMVVSELEPWADTAGWSKVAVVSQQASVWG